MKWLVLWQLRRQLALRLRNKSVISHLWLKIAHTPWHILNKVTTWRQNNGLFNKFNICKKRKPISIPSLKCTGRTVVCKGHCRPTAKQYCVPTVRAVHTQYALSLHCGNLGPETLHCTYTILVFSFRVIDCSCTVGTLELVPPFCIKKRSGSQTKWQK